MAPPRIRATADRTFTLGHRACGGQLIIGYKPAPTAAPTLGGKLLRAGALLLAGALAGEDAVLAGEEADFAGDAPGEDGAGVAAGETK